ncbi:tRNA pseudouridine(38-40) synthase TruA [Cytobacillus sp. Hz8]|uniref:tRNA pseudouridine(38-40) synthase TruA n=1 Tax=Cytobacillus sp. Hz8 TaxID=3347168 RepID=UPI0035DA55FB
MQRLKCKVQYDGTSFSGYQVQPNKRTVQGELEKALQRLHKGGMVKVYASGRTDAGVHAKGQIIHFDSPLAIPLIKWETALQSMLPQDIAVSCFEMVAPGFHARFDAKGKEYRYFVHISPQRDPFKRNYSYHYSYPLDFEKMRNASESLLGTHDFTSFCSAKSEVEDKVRTIHAIEISQDGDLLMFRFVGNGFLYNMVRILVGTLLEVGSGGLSPASVKEIIERKDRQFAGKTAPPQGLFLWEVFY